MTPEPYITRQVHLPQLGLFCRALSETLSLQLGPERALDALRSSVSACCVGCGIQVVGEELCALNLPSAASSHPKLERLRRGDCARQGCDSYYYQFTFHVFPGIDWRQLLPVADRIQVQLGPAPEAAQPWRERLRGVRRLCGQVPRRAWVACAVVALLLLVRHWHRGGPIPIIRQAENFQVDVAPSESAPHPARVPLL